MAVIDYSKYTYKQLLEAKSTISSEVYPENASALFEQLEQRKDEVSVDVIRVTQKEEDAIHFSLAEKRVKIIGYIQIITAIVIFYYLVQSTLSTSGISGLSASLGMLFVSLNLTAGYTAIKEKYKWYWLSIVNQALQIPNFALGTLLVNYSGIGGIFIGTTWSEEGNKLSSLLSLNPGFQFLQFSDNIISGYFYIDILAVIFASALVTVRDKKIDLEHEKNTNQKSTAL